MANKNKALILGLHERLMKQFIKQISESISNIHEPITGNKSDSRKDDALVTTESSALPQEHSGPDKINEIRNEAAATQSEKTTQLAQILNPDKQSELMEIVKQKCEEFERELHHLASEDNNVFEEARQKFKDELMGNTHKELAKKRYAFIG
jgi:hypothetical protein